MCDEGELMNSKYYEVMSWMYNSLDCHITNNTYMQEMTKLKVNSGYWTSSMWSFILRKLMHKLREVVHTAVDVNVGVELT